MNLSPEEMKDRIRVAEEAVSGMADENLKRVAFETILAHSFGTVGASSEPKRSKANSGGNKKRSNQKPKTARPIAEKKVASFELGVEQLKELKKFYDDQAPSGAEEVVFTLAVFIHDVLKKKIFHEADVYHVYSNLISLKPAQKPPALSEETLKRAMTWLVAPSRKKGWLKSVEGGFEISPKGILHMTYKDEASKK